MRSLTEFLTESKKSYTYRIKIAGDLPKEHVDSLKKLFAKFDMTNMSDIKKTPVMKCPYDFPDLENVSVNIMDVTFDYPASSLQLQELMQPLGINPNRVKIMSNTFADSIDIEAESKEHDGALLDDATLPETTAEQKAASEEYAKPGEQRAAEMETREYEFSAPKTSRAQTTSDLPQGTKSPIGS